MDVELMLKLPDLTRLRASDIIAFCLVYQILYAPNWHSSLISTEIPDLSTQDSF